MGCNQLPPGISALLLDVEDLDWRLDACRLESKQRMDERANVSKKKQFDKTEAKVIPFKIGDEVLVKQNLRAINKLDSNYRDSCVIQINDNDRYTVKGYDAGNELYVSHDDLRLVSLIWDVNLQNL